MAVTAAITLGASSGTAPCSTSVICTITNGGAGTLSVLSIQPTVVASGLLAQNVSVALGMPNIGQGQNNTVLGSNGTLAPYWGAVFYAPIASNGSPSEPATEVYTLGALIYMSDGSIVSATTADFTASARTP